MINIRDSYQDTVACLTPSVIYDPNGCSYSTADLPSLACG